jgi:hypothetical protein
LTLKVISGCTLVSNKAARTDSADKGVSSLLIIKPFNYHGTSSELWCHLLRALQDERLYQFIVHVLNDIIYWNTKRTVQFLLDLVYFYNKEFNKIYGFALTLG